LLSLGISHRISCPHTHQQNGAVEHKHRHIVEIGLSILSHPHVPSQYWDDAFSTVCYLINRMPTLLLKNRSPFELLFNCKADYTFLRTFGCACWQNLHPYNSNKLQPRSIQCLFLGYSSNYKGYKCLHLPTKCLYISWDVVFDKVVFSPQTYVSQSLGSLPYPSAGTLYFSSPGAWYFFSCGYSSSSNIATDLDLCSSSSYFRLTASKSHSCTYNQHPGIISNLLSN
jgi:hypothetical protein